ncbi:MAG: DegT/DnrJ/EryC1/StrS family aminotransferase [Alphaproteobacteria bacterium]|nr:DegT/DnrJ/EryC1/StrS family aminotransferase [Alphaproteobacteria bacterium]
MTAQIQPLFAKRYIIPDMPTADEVLPYLRQIDANLWYSNFGPLVSAFETKFIAQMAKAHPCETPFFAATVTSGYHALSVALRLMGIGSGCKVLIPAVTFPACPLAVQNLGAEAILCDIDPDTWTLTPAIARAAAAQMKLDAIMPVCLYGMAVPSEEWDAFTQETGIPILIDAAAAIETQSYLKHGFVAHSLHATKPFGVGEGGLLVTADEGMISQIRQTTNFGTVNRITQSGGENAKMSEYHAAVALAQLDRWEHVKARRAELVSIYTQELQSAFPLARIHNGLQKSVVCNLMVSVKQGLLPTLLAEIEAQGIATHRTYLPPLTTHPHFSDLCCCDRHGKVIQTPELSDKREHMNACTHLDQTVMGLPFYPQMTNDDATTISRLFCQTLHRMDTST